MTIKNQLYYVTIFNIACDKHYCLVATTPFLTKKYSILNTAGDWLFELTVFSHSQLKY
jgi:hypothetical protein